MDEWHVLQEFAVSGSEDAFGRIVSRYGDMVYSMCLRQVRDAHLAEDVTQAVFLLLARKAKTIRSGVVLGGWLCTTAKRASASALRLNMRRRQHELEVAGQVIDKESSGDWLQVAPALDSALARLTSSDRNAVLLRFFERKSLREVGDVMGVTEDAARVRVARALTKLRRSLLREEVAVAELSFAGLLTTHAVQPPPPGFLVLTTQAAVAGARQGAVSGACVSIADHATRMLYQAKTKTAAIVVTLLLAGGVAVSIEARNFLPPPAAVRTLDGPPISATGENRGQGYQIEYVANGDCKVSLYERKDGRRHELLSNFVAESTTGNGQTHAFATRGSGEWGDEAKPVSVSMSISHSTVEVIVLSKPDGMELWRLRL